MSAAAVYETPPPGGASLGQYQALVLNADYTPLSYVPLSVWSWQDALKAVFRDVATVLTSYDVKVSSPSVEIELPSVIVLKEYVPMSKRGGGAPAFTRRNLYMRDCFTCQYCAQRKAVSHLTYDHVVPRAKQGPTGWDNVRAASERSGRARAQRAAGRARLGVACPCVTRSPQPTLPCLSVRRW